MDAMFRQRGVVMREIDGLPYKVHQISEDQWQIIIDNCARLPAGYTFPTVYRSYEEAVRALAEWPEAGGRSGVPVSGGTGAFGTAAGDDTGVLSELSRWTDGAEKKEEGDS